MNRPGGDMQRRGSSRKPVKGRRATGLKPRKASTARVSTTELQEQVAALTRKVTEAREQLTEALEYQNATGEVLNVISRSPTDVQRVFDMIAESAVRLCEGQFCAVYRFDGQLLHFVAHHSLTPEMLEMNRRAYPAPPSRRTAAARAILERDFVQIPDISADPEYVLGAMSVVGGYRSVVAVPILRDGLPIGSIAVARAPVGMLPDRQVELLKTFADQAAIAIENVRLFNETKEALEQQTATSEVLQVISTSPGKLEPVFNALLANATHICEAAFGNLFLQEGSIFRSVAIHSTKGHADSWLRNPVFDLRDNQGVPLERVVMTKQIVHIPDLRTDPSYIRKNARMVTFVEVAGARTYLVVPMLKEGEIVGTINMYRQEVRPFTDKQIKLVKNFAAQAVIAIENTRLLNELRQRTTDLAESLEQQTATSEVLKVISSSPGELEPVFQVVLENATRICEAKFGVLFRYENSAFYAAAMLNAPQAFVEFHRQRGSFTPPAGTPLDRLLKTGDTIYTVDEASEPNPGAPARFGGARSLVTVPMRKESKLVGAIIIYRQEVRPFTDKQIELLTNFAAQAVIAIENARLLSELRESLQQQTATAEVLKVISSSTGELQPVFQAMLENATRICEASYGAMWLREGDALRNAAFHGALPAAFTEQWRSGMMARLDSNTPLARAAQSRKPLQVADLRDDQAYRDGQPLTVTAADVAGIRTLLSVPMLKDGELVGAIVIYRKEVRPFTDKQVELVENFAAQAVIAIENARLLNELRARTNELAQSVGELRALGEVSQAVNSTLELEKVLTTIVGRAVDLSHTDTGAIYVFDEEGKEFRLHATYGMSEAMIAAISGQHIGLGHGNVGAATAQRKPVQVSDIRNEPASPVNEIILREGYRGILAIPLLRPDQIIGALVVRRKTPGEFPQSTIDLLQTFADQSVVAIQNARLYENVETRTRELAASLEDLRSTQDRLVQTQKLASLGQLTAGIAHEIKNPLNFVNNFSGISVELIDELRQALAGANLDSKLRAEIGEIADTLQGNLDKVVQHGKRADAIVKNMLLHSREGSGEHRPVDVNALVEESLNLAYHGARAEKQGFNITMERSLDPAAGQADVFPQDLTRVLLNLISNGFYAATKRKAGADGDGYEPTLVTSTRSLGDRVEIRIRDNGTGIPPEVKEKMFNPFFTTKPAGEGTGLGLSICHDIVVKQHGGSIEVETQPGEFTEIRVTLPRVAALIS